MQTSQNQILLYIGNHDSFTKKTIAYGSSNGLPISIIDLTKIPLTQTHLLELKSMLKVKVSGLFNENNTFFKSNIIDTSRFSTDDLLLYLQRYPKMLKTPIAIKGRKAIFIKTPSDILDFG